MKLFNTTTLLCMLLLSTAAANTITVNDPFNNADICNNASCDVIGNGVSDRALFDIQKATFTMTPSTVTASLSFNFGPGNTSLAPFVDGALNLSVGDLFITVNGVPMFFMPLVDRGDLIAGDIYQGSGLTAQTVLGNPSGVNYRNNAVVEGAQGSSKIGSVTENITGGGDGSTNPEFGVTFTFSSSELNSIPAGALIGFSFASATCGNDVISGQLESTVGISSAAPEPSTSVMGIIGIIGLALGIRKNAAQKDR